MWSCCVCPALDARREDIPLLAQYFLQRMAQKYGKNVNTIANDAMEILVGLNWPGNIRQLENFVEQLVALTASPVISATCHTVAVVWRSCGGDVIRRQHNRTRLPDQAVEDFCWQRRTGGAHGQSTTVPISTNCWAQSSSIQLISSPIPACWFPFAVPRLMLLIHGEG